MRKNDASISNQLNRLAGRLRQWRNAHPPKTRLPEKLWEAAVQVAGREGIYRTARSLHLDYANLKRRVEAASASLQTPALLPTSRKRRTAPGLAPPNQPGAGRTAPTAFVELLADSIAPDCLIELEGAGGSRMRIRMKMSPSEVVNLVQNWREDQR